MAYNKEELLKLPVKERQELAESLWNSIDDNAMPANSDEIDFAKSRYAEHTENPDDGIALDILKEKIRAKYGF
jgi:putative addiction module component (TIGR02574 family)